MKQRVLKNRHDLCFQRITDSTVSFENRRRALISEIGLLESRPDRTVSHMLHRGLKHTRFIVSSRGMVRDPTSVFKGAAP